MKDSQTELLDQAALAEQPSRWAAFAAAVQFLTRIPLPAGSHASPAALRRCPVYFPLVGALIGVVTTVVVGATSLVWPVWLAVLIALAVEARLTGALHEDAVADFCDAFGGGWTRDDVLTILKDSRIGTYGALGLGLAVTLRAGATFEIVHRAGQENWLVWSSALVASCAVGRWVVVLVMVCAAPVARRESLSRDVGSQLTRGDLLVATLWTIPVVAFFAIHFPFQAAFAATLLVPTVWWFLRLVQRRIGGITGDCLGSIAYVSQVLVLLAAAARWPL